MIKLGLDYLHLVRFRYYTIRTYLKAMVVKRVRVWKVFLASERVILMIVGITKG